jgi:hypothetical protein
MFDDLAIEIDAEQAEKDVMKDFESFGDLDDSVVTTNVTDIDTNTNSTESAYDSLMKE